MKHSLIIHQQGGSRRVAFSGQPTVQQVLLEAGLAQDAPCGGRGTCGKCAVRLTGQVSPPNAAERRLGTRLACQAVLCGDGEVFWEGHQAITQIQLDAVGEVTAGKPMQGGYGAAIDLGTTTLALRLYDLRSGALLQSMATQNPQTQVAADVMSRIGAACAGEGPRLQALVTDALEGLLQEGSQQAGIQQQQIAPLVITGNTAMLYLLCGRNPAALSKKPFLADHLFDEWVQALNREAYLPPCMDAFVGADLACAVLHSGMCKQGNTALLIDVGTNGELALWHQGRLFVSSTAAGPAFEGAGIHLGSGSVKGAVDRVWHDSKGRLAVHVIGEAPAASICGSGLIDAIACLLEGGQVDETGASEQERLLLTEEVYLLPRDVRNVQLAKAAIAAGIEILLCEAGLRPQEVPVMYLAGGFGSHLNLQSAERIGLIPPGFAEKTQVLGNAALAGAASLLMDTDRLVAIRDIANTAVHLPLGGKAAFNQAYIEHMLFPEQAGR